MPEWVLGLGGSSHDYSAALMYGTDIVVGIEEERLSRVKYGLSSAFANPCGRAISYCLEYAGVQFKDISRVVSSDLLPHRARSYFTDVPLTLYDHHLTHAASAWLLAPPSASGGIIVYDGLGSVAAHPGPNMRAKRETFSFYRANPAAVEHLATTYGEGFVEHTSFSMGYTNSIGQLYEIVNAAVGFGGLESGKTMGLAGWGRPRFLSEFEEHLRIGSTLESVFEFDPFNGFAANLEELVRSEDGSFTVKADLASTAQHILENVLRTAYSLLREEVPDGELLAIAGGCGLNTVANGLLAAELPRSTGLLIPPHAGDAGLSFGALWLDAREHSPGRAVTFRGAHPHPSIARPARSYALSEVQRAANEVYPDVMMEPATCEPADLARLLADGEVVAVFDGSSEFGPRALGGRSILADPRTTTSRERINRRIKHREPFRPVAPLILEREFDSYFYPAKTADEFMLKVTNATELCKRFAPAVVHIDGTARAQVVSEQNTSFFAEVLEHFFALTGVPILINTSFNRRGEPIVESPAQALAAFAAMPLDALWIEGRLFRHVRVE